MKGYFSILVIATLITSTAYGSTNNTSRKDRGRNNKISLTAPIDTASYAVGISYGARLYQSLETFPGGKINVEALIDGFTKSIRGDSAALILDLEGAEAYFNQYLMEIQAKEAEAEIAAGEAFLAENKTKEGVITTESGLQYKIIKEGNGPRPSAEDVVIVHYTGKLLDGTVFESSTDGEPVTIKLDQVISGWTEGLQTMPTGSKYIFWIPSELAYGAQGAGQLIKPYSTLGFEVELLEIAEQ